MRATTQPARASGTVVVRGGTVVDGTGAPGVRADVALAGGRVVAVGPGLRGDRELDAGGCIVAPGFIDIHTHYDAQVFWDPALTPSCFHGVTTVVAGNCGFSIAPMAPAHRDTIIRTLERVEDMNAATLAAGIPDDFVSFPDYLAAVARRGVGLNFAAYVGHSAVRLHVMGPDASTRTATADEIAQMAALVTDALRRGAAGFATSRSPTHRGGDGNPVPSRLADPDELLALFAAAGATRRGVVEITTGDHDEIAALYALQPSIGLPITYAPLITTESGSHWRLLEMNTRGWEAGAQVWPQVSCRPVVFSMTLAQPFTLNPNPAFARLGGEGLAARRRAYADPAWRDEARREWLTLGDLAPRWDTYEIMEAPANRALEGRRVSDLARAEGRHPFDTVLDLALAEPDLGLRVRCVLMNDDEPALETILRDDHCALGISDAGAHVGMLCDAPLPTDLLGGWVRDRGVLSLEAAVRRLTSAPAALFGFADRGVLRPGAWADLVVFDPATVGPGPTRRVRDFPADGERYTADDPTGIRHVLVNGTPIRLDGTGVAREPDAPWPGHVIAPDIRTDPDRAA